MPKIKARKQQIDFNEMGEKISKWMHVYKWDVLLSVRVIFVNAFIVMFVYRRGVRDKYAVGQ